MEQRIKNKIALITGAANGIGEAIAKLFAEEGATVIITDIDDAKGNLVAQPIGSKAQYLHLDVADENHWQQVIDQIIQQHERLDILVNNAGITGLQGSDAHDPEHCKLEEWRRVHQVNLDSVFLGCKHAIRVMKINATGTIVNIASRSGLVGVPGACAYASSKAAIRNHTKSVALYCAEQGYNIRCNVIHPAAILTPIWEPMLGQGAAREERMKQLAETIPLKRMGNPIDVAYAALYFASDESAYVTGTELIVDGGILAGTASAPVKKSNSRN